MTAVPARSAEPVLRPITGPDEVELFNRLPYCFNHEVAEDLASGRRRPDWTWIALDREDRLLARLAWWRRPHDPGPLCLDILDHLPGQETAAAALLEAALAAVVPEEATPPNYTRFLTSGWREDPAERAAVHSRLATVEQFGARLFVERLRLEWTPASPVPEPTGRLGFRPVADESELVDLLARILTGTLDAHSRDDLTRMSPREAARHQLDDEFAHYTTPRDWWRVATVPGSGEPAGLVIAARNQYRPIIAYIGVLPEHRGRGYIDEILGEGTRVLAATRPDRIRASTDVGNHPMAASFLRCGYTVFEREIVMTWS